MKYLGKHLIWKNLISCGGLIWEIQTHVDEDLFALLR